MTKASELSGKRFGRTVAISRASNSSSGKARWNCVCDCGKSHISQANSLVSGKAQSCGCLHLEITGNKHRIHGLSNTSTYRAWSGMKDRCSNINNSHFAYYGGRGITIDQRWAKFENFVADMGEAPKGYSIDRIDNDMGYNRANCRWATPTTQSRNRRCAKLSQDDASLIKTLRGLGVPQSSIASMFSVSKSTVKDIGSCRTWKDVSPIPV